MTYTQKKIDDARELLNYIGYNLFHGFDDGAAEPRYRDRAVAIFSEMLAYNYERRKRQEEVYKRCPYLRTM